MKRLAILAIIVALPWGCVTQLDSGDTHKARYLVIGLGVVWVSDSVPEAATVSGVKSVGITVSDRPGMKLAVGYTDSYAVTVPDSQANVSVEFSRKLDGDAKVEVTPAKIPKEGEYQCK